MRAMGTITKFQEMNGCSACKHASTHDPEGKSAAVHDKGYWCKKAGKPVDSKDGSACAQWEYEG